MQRLSIGLVFVTALASFTIGCTQSPTAPVQQSPTAAAIHDPFPDAEAELIALSLSGALCAPLPLYEQVRSDMAAIRENWSQDIPELLSVTHIPPYEISVLRMQVEPESFAAMQNGTYMAWDSLNAALGFDSVVFHTYKFASEFHYATLTFQPRLNPERLAELYADLPGLIRAEPNVRIGDTPNIYGRLSGGERHYTFRHAWGDCPAGCIFSETWEFVAGTDGIRREK